MKLLQQAKQGLEGRLTKGTAVFLAALLALLPGFAMAAGGENVTLNFTDADKIYLYISLGFGVLAIVFAFLLRQGLMKQSAGSEKMQAVGLAIREGALAYLRRQVTTMSIFVAVLAVGLFFLYGSQYGSMMLGLWIAVSFIGGVAASYIAGYMGMLMAVAANMRTAHAALTSYKGSLEVAFRSGAVAGLVTVGMGLIGATLILMFASADAMKLLIGFGFGGSLAALFMRVGGGIFTKAADVGADLVGKVEAGIPEDDPRNPATIADNVGDNVGDCAGMAADVFESYEVTLVAAIVLGAATAAIFDQATWMRLVLFALMARGVGIVASIIGIYSVRGSEDIDMDPLRPIRKGFQVSAVVALLGTAGLAWYMMGGQGNPIVTSNLKSIQQVMKTHVLTVQEARGDIARQKNIDPFRVPMSEVVAHPSVKALGIPEDRLMATLPVYLRASEADLESIQELREFSGLDLTDKEKAGSFTVMRTDAMGGVPQYMSLEQAYKDLTVFEVNRTTPKGAMTEAGPAKEDTTQKIWVLTHEPAKFEEDVRATRDNPQAPKDEILSQRKASVYVNARGQLAFGVDGLDNVYAFEPRLAQDQIFAYSEADLKSFQESAKLKQEEATKIIDGARNLSPEQQQEKFAEYRQLSTEAQAMQPTPVQPTFAVVDHHTVPWYMFLAAIAFGILMAFAIEILTDYYVSTHKKPVQEIAGVSTAGPAPMIIQGFALAAESSVFSVFAIVVALIAPLLFFPPGDYGSYLLSFYGIALVGLGLLTTTGYILAMDTFGPISDNAQGVYEMSGEGHDSPNGAKAVQRLDAAGNTTKALTKGFAIATAVVAAVALFHSYVESAMLTTMGLRLEVPEIFLGLLIGGAAPYLFSAFSINAVGRASFELINEVRRQFRADAGIMAGTSKPDYGRCVAIVTRAAQRELLGPGILAIALPAAVAFGFSIGKDPVTIGGAQYNLTGAQALGGFLAGAILSGQLMAVLLANSGGMWDNAKKLVEDGLFGGKGSEAHKAAVVCDTVGDPFKDTAGPALNPLIKVMNLVALLLAPVVIQPFGTGILATVTITSLALLAFSVWWSKRGSMSSAMEAAVESAGATPLAGDSSAASAAPDNTVKKRKITVDDDPTV